MAALWPRINVCLQAVAQILLVICLGVWLSARRGLDRKAIAAVSGVNWHVLLPALMFSSIVGAVTPSGLLQLWPLLMLSVLHVAIGAVPALLLCLLFKLPKDISFFTISAASLPNCGNLPWLFMPTIIRFYTPADQVVAQVQYSTGLTSVYTIIVVVITLVVPFLFKRPPDTMVLPRSSSTASMDTQAEEALELPEQRSVRSSTAGANQLPEGLSKDALQAPQHERDQGQQQQQQQQQQQAASQQSSDDGATVWVVPGHNDSAVLDAASQPDTQLAQLAGQTAAATAGETRAACTDSTQRQQQRDQDLPSPLPQASSTPGSCQPVSGTLGDLQPGHTHLFSKRQHQQHKQQQQHSWQTDSRQQTQQQHAFDLQPSVDGPGSFSFSSHRSSSLLLSQSRQLLGSFRRSLSRGVTGGLRRSASFVQLVWSFPTGWQPQRSGHTRHDSARHAGTRPAWLQRPARLWSAFLAHPVVNLPLGATLVGLACAAIGPVRGWLVKELAPLHWFWLSLGWVGAAAAPLATMQIGAELMQTSPVGERMHVARRVQWTANVIAIVVKLIIVPLVNIALLRLGGLSKLVPQGDSVYQLLMLVEAAVPAAVTLLVVCSRVYPDIRPLSSMLFWQYVASLFTLPVFLVWFLYMLER